MSELFNKAGLTTQRVARELCGVSLGERIPTISALEKSCGASRGNVQKALQILKEEGAISLEAHGQNGTLLTSIDYLALARSCGFEHPTVAMPLPYTSRYEGLATALFTLLNTEGQRAYITFMRGSEARAQTLLDGSTTYCVMSRLAYDDYVSRGYRIGLALECGPLSYVGRHVLISRDASQTDWSGARVGIDESSVDQSVLTRRFFAHSDVEYVPVQYTNIVQMVESGQIDAGVWNEDDFRTHTSTLSTRFVEGLFNSDDNTNAVVVTRSDDYLARQLLRLLANPQDVRAIQKQVMEGQTPARY